MTWDVLAITAKLRGRVRIASCKSGQVKRRNSGKGVHVVLLARYISGERLSTPIGSPVYLHSTQVPEEWIQLRRSLLSH